MSNMGFGTYSNLKEQFSAVQFKLWDLHLYLDTHLCDTAMLKLFHETAEQFNILKNEYEMQYGPLTPGAGAGANWVKSPWPWELKGEARNV